jgi:hypothetical protein
MTIHVENGKVQFVPDNADDENFLETMIATFVEGGAISAFPNHTPADSIALEPAEVSFDDE